MLNLRSWSHKLCTHATLCGEHLLLGKDCSDGQSKGYACAHVTHNATPTYLQGAALRQRRTAMNEFLYTVPYVPVPGQKVRPRNVD